MIEFPGRSLQAIIIPFKPLGARETFVDMAAQRFTDHGILFQFIKRFIERAGQPPSGRGASARPDTSSRPSLRELSTGA